MELSYKVSFKVNLHFVFLGRRGTQKAYFYRQKGTRLSVFIEEKTLDFPTFKNSDQKFWKQLEFYKNLNSDPVSNLYDLKMVKFLNHLAFSLSNFALLATSQNTIEINYSLRGEA